MVQHVKEKIQAAKIMIKFRKTQLEQAQQTIRRNHSRNKEQIESKYRKHIEALWEFFTDYKKRQENLIQNVLELQDSRVADVCEEIAETLENLESHCQKPLRDYENNDDEILVFMNDEIDKLNSDLFDFIPQINLEGIQVDFEVHNTTDTIQRIEQILVESASLFQENLYSEDGLKRPIISYADFIKNNWNCMQCGMQFGIKQVDCVNCKVFRPLETFQNILNRPERVTP